MSRQKALTPAIPRAPYKPWENNKHTLRMLRSILRDSQRESVEGDGPIIPLSPGEVYALRRAIRMLRGGL